MTHIICKEQEEFKALQSGRQPFFIHKVEKYAVDPGEKLVFQETKNGDHTGEEWEAYAHFITNDGLLKNRQAIAVKEKES